MPTPAPTAGKSLRSNPLAAAVCRLLDFTDESQCWVKDADGRYRWMNRRCLLDYGLERPEQVVGRTDYDLSPVHIADQFRRDDEAVLNGLDVLSRVELVGRFDHTASWCFTRKVPVRGPGGRPLGTAGMASPLAGRPAEQVWPEAGLGKAVEAVQANPAGPISSEDLAEIVGLSVRAFERRFRKWFRVSPHRFLQQVRVRTACRALVAGTDSLAAVAAANGFCDQSHFTREFRRHTGMTPGEYRARYGLPG